MSFVFFDTETTGLRHGFDQILHFAAIRTDSSLNEIARFEVRSRLLPHVIPHPQAVLTNGLPIGRLLDPELPSHYEMVRSIRQRLLSWSPAIFVCYNSIRFDEEMLRQAFFQTLHPPYLTSNQRNCRADAFGLMMAAATISPACLNIPTESVGHPTFRLELLAEANGIQIGEAHNAMSDVGATLELCRLVNRNSPELWQRFVRFSNKAAVADFIESEDGFILTEFFGNRAYHTPVVYIGPDIDQPNARLCLSLGDDVTRFSSMTDEQLRNELAQKPCPLRRLRINAAPTLTAFHEAPDQMINYVEIDVVENRARWIKNNLEMGRRLTTFYASTRETYKPSRHPEERIYESFPSREDEARMNTFHDAGWQDRLAIVQGFSDERLRLFGLRLILFEARATLTEDLRRDLDHALAARLLDDDGGSLTLGQALAAIEELLREGIPDARGLLADYKKYLRDRVSRVADYRAKQFGN